MSNIKLTPMHQIVSEIHNIRSNNSYEASPMLVIQWLSNNIDRLLYEEKYLIVDSIDDFLDPDLIDQTNFEKTPGQLFFEANFINL